MELNFRILKTYLNKYKILIIPTKMEKDFKLSQELSIKEQINEF